MKYGDPDSLRSVVEMNLSAMDANRGLEGKARRRLLIIAEEYLRSIMHYCVVVARDALECAQRLEDENVREHFERYLELQEDIGDKPDAPTADTIDLIAIPILLGISALAVRYLSQTLEHGNNTPFWGAYVKGLRSVVEHRWSGERPTKLKSMENHWILYLDLMESLVREADTARIIERANMSFKQRNADNRLTNVTCIDPSGRLPLGWDCRLAYILALNKLF